MGFSLAAKHPYQLYAVAIDECSWHLLWWLSSDHRIPPLDVYFSPHRIEVYSCRTQCLSFIYSECVTHASDVVPKHQ